MLWALFVFRVAPVRVRLELAMYMPAPRAAWLFIKVTFVNLAVLLAVMAMAPPCPLALVLPVKLVP